MSATVAIKGLSTQVSQSDITTACGSFGTVIDVTILPGGTEAMVTFEQNSEAEAAVKGLKNSTLKGCTLTVGILSQPVSGTKSDGTDLLGLYQGLDKAAKLTLLSQLQGEFVTLLNPSSVKGQTGSTLGASSGLPLPQAASSSSTTHPQLPWLLTKSHVDPPRLPVFSGDGKECTYAQWKYEVACLHSGGTYPPDVLMHAIRRSVRSKAAEVLLHLGESASISDILQKYDARFGEVLSMQQLLERFHETKQGDDESITVWGCRLEDLMSRARADGTLPLAISETLLKNKFRSGLKSEGLRAALRTRVESGDSFDSLLVYARTVEQELSSASESTSKGKPVKAGQSVMQAAPSTRSSVESKLDELLKQMRTLDGRVQKLERRDETGSGPRRDQARGSEPNKTERSFAPHQQGVPSGNQHANQDTSRPKGSNFKCNYCKLWGHVKRECPSLLAKQAHQGE
jgi:hypothetical protein